jgi:hypothetical protein
MGSPRERVRTAASCLCCVLGFWRPVISMLWLDADEAKLVEIKTIDEHVDARLSSITWSSRDAGNNVLGARPSVQPLSKALHQIPANRRESYRANHQQQSVFTSPDPQPSSSLTEGIPLVTGSSSMDQYWYLGMREHLHCLAAQEDSGYAMAAVGGHDNQVTAL